MSGVVDYFWNDHWLTPLQTRISIKVRRKIFDRWMTLAPLRVGRQLLDIGATPDTSRPDSNCFLPWFHENGFLLTLYSPEDLTPLRSKFPFAKIVPPAHGVESGAQRLPFSNQQFDWVFSSAVLEHVGSSDNQRFFLQECARVGNALCLTTPNRSHWLEFHTKIPLLHWLPKRIHRALLKLFGLKFWSEEKNLNLLNGKELLALAKSVWGEYHQITLEKTYSLGMPSNLMLIVRPTR